jgi:23S rRNA (cytosine1962-C5)-methyltransferase
MQQILTEIRRHLPVDNQARRLFHGRGRCFPGYQDVLIDSYGELIWITLFAAREDGWLRQLALLLREELPQSRCIAVQRRDLPTAAPVVLSGTLPESPRAFEAGLCFQLRPTHGQNIGFFIDMARGRALVRQRSQGKKVLNLFAYTCSFSVAALVGGATQVVNVDMNRGALELGRLNHQLNQLDLRCASFLNIEIFRSFSRLRQLGPFDLIICDPPHSQGKSFKAESHWPKLIDKIPTLLASDGEFIACLNAPHLDSRFLHDLVQARIPVLQEISCLTAGADFPEADARRVVSIHHYSQAVT